MINLDKNNEVITMSKDDFLKMVSIVVWGVVVTWASKSVNGKEEEKE